VESISIPSLDTNPLLTASFRISLKIWQNNSLPNLALALENIL